MNSHIYFMSYIPLLFLFLYKAVGDRPIDTTLGFAAQPLNQSDIDIQKPYDIPLEQRYNFSNGIHKLWVLKTDKPHSRRSKCKFSGVWQFETYGYVPHGTSGVCIMQVFGSRHPSATTTMLTAYDDKLYYYRNPVILSDIYDRWFRLNVIHDVEGNNVKVYIDGVLKHDGPGHGGRSHYFKCGVYSQNDGSFCMESRWKDITILKKT